jgi:hypothetical protein
LGRMASRRHLGKLGGGRLRTDYSSSFDFIVTDPTYVLTTTGCHRINHTEEAANLKYSYIYSLNCGVECKEL